MFQLLLLAVLSVTVYTNDTKQKLEIPPPPAEGFNINSYLGRWFVQFRRAPCSWPGSTSFTDYEHYDTLDRKGGVLGHVTWRSRGVCNSITDSYTMISPGVFTYVDNIGDSISSRLLIVAIDKKHFMIFWGCTKMSAIGDRCEDPFISVSTRLRFPPSGVLNMVEKFLRTRFGITIGELQKVPHKMPCRPNFHKKG